MFTKIERSTNTASAALAAIFLLCNIGADRCSGAVDFYSTSASPGSWLTPLDWSLRQLPSTLDTANISGPVSGIPNDQGLDGNFSVANVYVNAMNFVSLAANSASSANGRTLTLNGVSSSSPLFDLGIANTGIFYLGGQIGGQGQITVQLPT